MSDAGGDELGASQPPLAILCTSSGVSGRGDGGWRCSRRTSEGVKVIKRDWSLLSQRVVALFRGGYGRWQEIPRWHPAGFMVAVTAGFFLVSVFGFAAGGETRPELCCVHSNPRSGVADGGDVTLHDAEKVLLNSVICRVVCVWKEWRVLGSVSG